jgi:putative heme transporter
VSQPRRRARTSLVRALLVAGIFVGTAAAVYSQRGTIGDGIHDVRYLNWAWVAGVSLIQVLSMLALALLYQTLLQASSARIKVSWLLSSSYIANGISISVPVIGAGIASRLAYQRFRAAGADAAAASLALTLAGVVSTVTLAPEVTAAAVLSGNPAASASGLFAAIAMVTVAAVVAVEMRSEPGRARLLRLIAFLLRSSQRVFRHPKGQAQILAQTVLASIQRMRLGRSVLTRAVAWGLVNWWADVACLVFALRAAGISLSIGKILLVWTAATGAGALSPTPAGIGAVELAMAGALTAAGVKGSHAITAILVYRVVTFKGIGTVLSLLYHYRRVRAERNEPAEEIVS